MTCLLTSSFVLLRIEKLLNTNVDIVMNQINLEMQGAISCGGKPVMEFRDVEAVLAAHPQLSQVGFGWLLLSVSSLFTHYSSLATSLVLPIQSLLVFTESGALTDSFSLCLCRLFRSKTRLVARSLESVLWWETVEVFYTVAMAKK